MPSLFRARWFGVAVLIAVIALVAVTAISFLTARELVTHRGAYVPALTPADSGMRYQTVPLRAADGTLLEGWWIPPSDGARRPDLAVVVLAHAEDGPWTRPLVPGGRPVSGKARMVRHAAWLHRAGFIVLAFDFRSYGGSSGFKTSGGYLEQQDLAAAVRLAHERAVGAPVAVLGEGMGATVALAVAARDSSIVAVVADSPNETWVEGMARVDSLGKAGPWWAGGSFPLLAEAFAGRDVGPGFQAQQGAILNAVCKLAKRPTMLIFGARDKGLSADGRGDVLRAAGTTNARLVWIVAAGARLDLLEVASDEYKARVSVLLKTGIGGGHDLESLNR